jgi:replicative DNA helicase
MREVSLNASQQGPVLIFSAEVTMRELTTLMISQKARVDYERALTGRLTEEELTPFIQQAGDIHDLPIRIYPNLDISATDVRLQVQNETAQGRKPVLVTVDYLGLMEHQKATRHDLEIAATTKALKKLALQCGVPILLLVQLNRETDKRGTEEEYSRPRLSDLRDSGSIEQDADNVIFLWLREKGAEHAPVSRRVLTVAKRRNGATFEVDLMFDRAAGHFYAAPKAEPETAQGRMYAKAEAAIKGGQR